MTVDRVMRAMHCHHEAGHGVAGVRLGHELRAISDDPPEVVIRFGPNAWRDELTTLAAGDAAVKRGGGTDRSQADADDARRLIVRMGRSWPMEWISAQDRAETLIERNWAAVERLAARLMQRAWLSASEATRLVLGGETDTEMVFLMRLAMGARNERVTT